MERRLSQVSYLGRWSIIIFLFNSRHFVNPAEEYYLQATILLGIFQSGIDSLPKHEFYYFTINKEDNFLKKILKNISQIRLFMIQHPKKAGKGEVKCRH